jgi:hypothetical protein
MLRFSKLLLILFLIYIASYVAFRQTHIEVWERDKSAYVIFPLNASFLYFVWRPLTYLDASITGMRFHIGPHR